MDGILRPRPLDPISEGKTLSTFPASRQKKPTACSGAAQHSVFDENNVCAAVVEGSDGSRTGPFHSPIEDDASCTDFSEWNMLVVRLECRWRNEAISSRTGRCPVLACLAPSGLSDSQGSMGSFGEPTRLEGAAIRFAREKGVRRK